MPRAAILLALAAVAAAAPAAAEADSLVYVKSGEVWIANADGSAAHAVTHAKNNWAWPSEADDGTIVAAGGAQRVNADGSDSSGSSELYRMTQAGTALGSPMLTPGSTSTPQCPTYGPTDVRVSPGGDKIAYTDFFCDDFLSFTTPANAKDFGPAKQNIPDYVHAAWIDDQRLLVTHDGPTLTADQPNIGVYDTASGTHSGPGWWTDPNYPTGYQATIARSGRTLAVLTNDAADWFDGTARHAQVILYAASGVLAGDLHETCRFDLDASKLSNPTTASPTLSSDGSLVAWGQDDGVHVASVAACGSGARVLVPGGAYPFFSPAALQPFHALKAAFRVVTKHPRAGHAVRLSAARSTGAKRYAWTFGDGKHASGKHPTVRHTFRKPGRYEVTLKVRGGGGTATVTHRVKVRRG